MRSCTRIGVTTWGLVLALPACAPAEREPSPVLVATVVAVDTLAESDTSFITKASQVHRARDGHVFVSDEGRNRVLEFDEDGRQVRSFGRDGDGPGEFRGVFATTLWGDDSLVVADISSRRISVFRRSNGEFLWDAEGLGSVNSVDSDRARLIVASFSATSGTAIGVLDSGSRAMRPALPLRPSLLRAPMVYAAFPRTVVTVSAGRIVMAPLWSDTAFVYDAALNAKFAFAIPRRLRRPVPANLEDTLRTALLSSAYLTLMPYLVSIEPLPDSHVAFIYKDWRAPAVGIADPTRVVFDAVLAAYATVVDLAGVEACADIELPTAWSENPRFFSDGATLAGVGHVVDSSSSPALELRRFDLHLGACRWEPLVLTSP